MKPLVIYHEHCTDGFGAAYAAWRKLGDDAEYLPMSYGDTDTHLDYTGRDLYIVDFSFPREVMEHMFANAKKVVWLDHHKTAFEMWCQDDERTLYCEDDTQPGHNCFILLDNNQSGAMLAWRYFHPDTEVPMLIKHIDDRDRWQFKLLGSKEIHGALASHQPWSFELWDELMGDEHYGTLFTEGGAILRAQEVAVKDMAKGAVKCEVAAPMPNGGWRADDVMSYKGLALNTNCHMSEVGHELANASGTFGLIYYIGANGKAKLSFRSNGDYDVSAIAKLFGGGGHRNAAGAETDVHTLLGWLN